MDVIFSFAREIESGNADAKKFVDSIGGLDKLFALVISLGEYPPASVDTCMRHLFTSDSGFAMLSSDKALQSLVAGCKASEYPSIQTLTLRQLNHWNAQEKTAEFLVQTTELFNAIVSNVLNEDTSVNQAAATTLFNLVQVSPSRLAKFFSEPTMMLLFPEEEQKEDGSPAQLERRLRALAMCIKVASVSKEAFAAFKSTGRLALWSNSLSSGTVQADPLLLLNFLELASVMVGSEAGLHELVSQGIIGQVLQLVPPLPSQEKEEEEEDMLVHMVRCGVIQFLEKFADAAYRCNWQDWAAHTQLADFLGDHIHINPRNEEDKNIVRSAINTVSTIACSSTSGLLLMAANPSSSSSSSSSRRSPLFAVPVFARSQDESLKVAALNGLAAVLSVPAATTPLPLSSSSSSLSSASPPPPSTTTGGREEAVEEKADQVAKAMLQALFEPAHCPGYSSCLHVVKRLSEVPIEEIQLSAIRVLIAVATRSWGVPMLLQEPGLFEYLLDNTDTKLQLKARQLRFTVVEQLKNNPVYTQQGALNDQQRQAVETYLAKTAQLAPASVATMGAS